MTPNSLAEKKIDAYQLFLQEPSRPPSRGGNTKALHSHVLTIDGVKYSFLALGSQQWVYKSDTVSFDYITTDTGYNNVIKETLETRDAKGLKIVRGNRGFKSQLRTAQTKAPGSRRERNG